MRKLKIELPEALYQELYKMAGSKAAIESFIVGGLELALSQDGEELQAEALLAELERRGWKLPLEELNRWIKNLRNHLERAKH